MDKNLLQRYITGDTTEEERLTVYDWIVADPQHLREYRELKKLHEIYIWNVQVDGDCGKKQSFRFKKIIIGMINIAAVLIVLLGVNFFKDKVQEDSIRQTVYVPAGQTSEVTLSDGTRVWLNSNTTLYFPSEFLGSKREVRLDGEGYFSVSHNKNCPFIVKTEQYDIEVLGTVFNVMAYDNSPLFEAVLLSGSVQVSDVRGRTSVILKPHMKAYRDGQVLSVGAVAHSDTLLWRQNIFSFYNNSFKEITEKLQNYYDVKIDLRNKRVADIRYTGKFRTEDGVEHILKVLKLDYAFEYEYTDSLKTIIIK